MVYTFAIFFLFEMYMKVNGSHQVVGELSYKC